MPTIDNPPAANDNAVFDGVQRPAKRSAPPWSGYRYRGPIGRPVALSFLQDGATHRARNPEHHHHQMAADGTPLDVEFRQSRLPDWLSHSADAFVQVYELANRPASAIPCPTPGDFKGDPEDQARRGYTIGFMLPETRAEERDQVLPSSIRSSPAPDRLAGLEVRVRASQVCALISYRCGHLYRDLVDAAVMGATLKTIGLRHGGNANDAAKVGREKVRDALVFAHAAFRDLTRWEAGSGPGFRKALPTRDLPTHWHTAANDDLRTVNVA